MERTFDWKMTKDEAAQLSAILNDCLEAMRSANKQIAEDEVEFDRLRTETERILKRDWRVSPDVETIF